LRVARHGEARSHLLLEFQQHQINNEDCFAKLRKARNDVQLRKKIHMAPSTSPKISKSICESVAIVSKNFFLRRVSASQILYCYEASAGLVVEMNVDNLAASPALFSVEQIVEAETRLRTKR
jgi:hypothetical protein